MSFWTELRMPAERELLVGFYDLAGYMRHAERTGPQELLATMAGYFALTGRLVSEAGGRLIKTLGDAGLVAFPSEAADAGVQAMRSLQSAGRDWLAERAWKTEIVVKLHLGPVAIGRVGSPGEEIIDVYGKTVNVAAGLPSAGLAMTPAVFRSLTPESRKLFRKHTPPISYIGAEDRRPE
jgi:class 3 adenylate cyclase